MNVSRYVCQFTRLGRRTLVEFVEKDKEEERGGGGFRGSRLMKGSGRSKSPDGVYLEKGRKFTSKYQ